MNIPTKQLTEYKTIEINTIRITLELSVNASIAVRTMMNTERKGKFIKEYGKFINFYMSSSTIFNISPVI